MFFLIFHLLV